MCGIPEGQLRSAEPMSAEPELSFYLAIEDSGGG
jgi:hypothetical protein